MKISAVLEDITYLYIETSPLIYYVEGNKTYADKVEPFITAVENEEIHACSSVITVTEVLIQPVRKGDTALEQLYVRVFLQTPYFKLEGVTYRIAYLAAELRARYNLRTPDALHIATAIEAGCDAFLTNDNGLKRISEINILVLDDLELDPST